MKNIIEEIKAISHHDYKLKNKTIVDNLLKGKWCEECDLIESYNRLSNAIEPSVVTFCQLPFPVFLPSKWIKTGFKIDTNYEIRFRVIGSLKNNLDKERSFKVISRENFDEEDRYINGWIQNDYTGQLVRTQVLIIFTLWGYRYEIFHGYKQTLEKSKKGNTIIENPRVRNPKDNNYFTIGTYESDILHRLKREVIKIFKNIIPVYSITCRQPIQDSYSNLYNYFIMMQSGRIVVSDLGESMLTSQVKEYPFSQYDKYLEHFSNFWTKRNKLSIYESYLMNAFNYIQAGSTNLAVIYSIMILEWFSHEIIAHYYPPLLHKKLQNEALFNLVKSKSYKNKENDDFRAPLFDRYKSYFPAIGINLSSKYLDQLNKIKKRRNSLIHKTKDDFISSKEAQSVVSLALEIINHVMEQLNKIMC